MEQNGIKRRMIESIEFSHNYNNRLLVDSSTNTECGQPMLLNAWTQTTPEEFTPLSNLPLIDELRGRIQKIEEQLTYLNDGVPIDVSAASKMIDMPNMIDSELLKHSAKSTQQSKYKIITSKGVEYIEPVEVVYAEEDGTYDLNTSNDSQRLEICLPKEEEEEVQQNEQEIQQQQQVEVHHIQKNHQQIYYQNRVEEQQDPHQIDHKYYNVPTLHNTLVSTALQTPIPSTLQQPSQTITTPKRSPEPKIITKKEQKPKIKKSLLGSTTNLTEISALATDNNGEIIDPANVIVSLGPHNTRVPGHIYETIDWNSATAATRKLLITIFDRETLATHTMTGKPSPAFRGRDMPTKQQLNPEIVTDIIFVVSRKCGVPEKDVRNAITTKCADENKMSKQREKKRKSLAECNKENVTQVSATETVY